ncbi:HAD-IIA family hydrolase [Halalkalibaculum sp. DA3122]|uniref:HAD-IIA family hydrolase n=1 Tax=unclassified Halalkalibaculum TaxID=2964617 RepID=UPI003754C3CD
MQHFYSIAKNYEAVFLDSYGVLKNHKGLIEGVPETINYLRTEGIKLRVLTNDASKSPSQQIEAFSKLGLTNLKEEEIITSAMLARQFLEYKIQEGKVAYLGTESSAEYILHSNIEKIPVREVDLDDAEDITAFVFLDDEGFDWNYDINKTVNLLRRRNVPAIVANTDKFYPVSKNDVAVATGGIAKLVQNMLSKKFIQFGKPDSQMFMHAYEHLLEEGPINRSDILMVGDTLHTDILGGNKFGVKTLLVFSGNTRKENAELQISSTGIIPDYICSSIVE